MALSFAPAVFTSATVAAVGTAVDPGIAIPENCAQVVIKNIGPGDGIFGVGNTTLPTVLVEGTNAVRLAQGESFTFSGGTVRQRGFMDGTQGDGFVYDAVAGAPPNTPVFHIIYINLLGDI